MRAFVAVEIPPDDTGFGGGGKAPTHLTLLFLGEVGSDRIAPICDRLCSVARTHPPFDLRLEGVGAFPSARAPRVIWQGASVGKTEVEHLAIDVRRALADAGGSASQEPFVPHVTLFRVRSPADRRAARELLDGRADVPLPRTLRVREFVLKESILGAGGAVHRTISSFRLEGRRPSAAEGSGAARSSTNFLQR